jgi:hypothetical protein
MKSNFAVIGFTCAALSIAIAQPGCSTSTDGNKSSPISSSNTKSGKRAIPIESAVSNPTTLGWSYSPR